MSSFPLLFLIYVKAAAKEIKWTDSYIALLA